MNWVMMLPSRAESRVMRPRASMAPAYTIVRGCFMAMMAAMKKVLSPISETTMTEKEAKKAWKKPNVIWGIWCGSSAESWSRGSLPVPQVKGNNK